MSEKLIELRWTCERHNTLGFYGPGCWACRNEQAEPEAELFRMHLEAYRAAYGLCLRCGMNMEQHSEFCTSRDQL